MASRPGASPRSLPLGVNGKVPIRSGRLAVSGAGLFASEDRSRARDETHALAFAFAGSSGRVVSVGSRRPLVDLDWPGCALAVYPNAHEVEWVREAMVDRASLSETDGGAERSAVARGTWDGWSHSVDAKALVRSSRPPPVPV